MPAWLGTERKSVVLWCRESSRIRALIKRVSGEVDVLKELDCKDRKHDCESEITRMLE